jgi:pyruvate kinase
MPVMSFIRTKIIATIGPASADRAVLEALVEAGVDVFRINFSHGTEDQRERFFDTVRAIEAARGVHLAVLADLCGPKIRVNPLAEGQMVLVPGQELVIQRSLILGAEGRISTTLRELIDEVDLGQHILLDDGKLRLEVIARGEDEITCRVLRGGILLSGKGINLPHSGLSLSALTSKDRHDVDWIAEHDIDYVALSFVRRAEDLRGLRALLIEKGSKAKIIAKIEKPQALDVIDEIIEEADGVMVARGDLGVEMDLPSVPVAQKRIARKCQAAGKACIIATQMLESMTQAPSPTRAEVSDVANAVLDLADAVMLSGETAAGKFPVEAVTTMNNVVSRIEAYHDEVVSPSRVVCHASPTVAALAEAVRQISISHDIAAVAVFTATGTTAVVLSKSRLSRPILAMSPSLSVARQIALYYGVIAVQEAAPEHTRDILKIAEEHLLRAKLARRGDNVAVLSGRPIGAPGATNTLVIHHIA